MAGANSDSREDRSGHEWPNVLLGFLRIGALAFGGGSATIVAMRELALRRRWLTDEEFLETVVLSRVTPGITILAQTILIGRKVDGVRGIVAAVVGMLLPSVTITILLARLYVSVRDQTWSQRPLEMIAALAAGFAVALALLLLKDTLSVDWHWRGPAGFLCYVALGAVAPNPLLLLVAAVAAGLLAPWCFVPRDAQEEDSDAP
ncbi:chromate transporter [Mycobacterium sp. AZCC_0083]|uniref:chromate transporter n=1 Tax=Mycobacterium sp. AZCC_0083 TaxID=2735882 RepID=UPI0016108FA6|nr:chromate transporter [Mycobacterium sp. AZCC_0083]MBB5165607.1 chromate transporter [Mycobacterium sp. AZCC_0083]